MEIQMEDIKKQKVVKNKKFEVRVEEDLFLATMEKAKQEDKTPSELLRDILKVYTSL